MTIINRAAWQRIKARLAEKKQMVPWKFDPFTVTSITIGGREFPLLDPGSVTVTHACDEDGDCGHAISVDGLERGMCWAHPSGDDPKEWARQLVTDEYGEETAARIDWENSDIVDD